MEIASVKTFTKVLAGITAVFLLFGAYIIFGPRLIVTDVRQSVVSATERQEAFSAIVAGVGRGDFGGNQFKPIESTRLTDYEFTTVTVAVQNKSVLRAEWAQVGISPVADDIVLVTGEPTDIPPFGTGELTVSILSHAGAATDRPLWVDYYLFGHKGNAAR